MQTKLYIKYLHVDGILLFNPWYITSLDLLYSFVLTKHYILLLSILCFIEEIKIYILIDLIV